MFYWSNNLEIVLILLIEVIIFHIRILIIKFKILGLERSVAPVSLISRTKWLVLSLFDIDLNELLEQHIGRSWLRILNWTWSGSGIRSRNRSRIRSKSENKSRSRNGLKSRVSNGRSFTMDKRHSEDRKAG